MMNDARLRGVFAVTGDWSTAALDPGVWYSPVCERGWRVIAAWLREEENVCRKPAEEGRGRRGGQG